MGSLQKSCRARGDGEEGSHFWGVSWWVLLGPGRRTVGLGLPQVELQPRGAQAQQMVWSVGISWGWRCWEQVSLREGPSSGAQWSPTAVGQRCLALMSLLAALQVASAA